MPQPICAVPNLLSLIGGTPLLRLRRLPEPGSGAVLCKCEQQNPGGSIKDRIALSMIEAAERDGLIRPGESIIVEPTSGNTGIGLSIVCAVKGYKLVLTMPESMSLERRSLLAAYGADLVLTPERLDMAGAVERAEALARSDSRYFMPQQFRNPNNPEAHVRTTGPEILTQIDQLAAASDDIDRRWSVPARIDAFVAGVGTGGTLTGVGQVLRRRFPDVRLIAVEPRGSAVLSGGKAGPHRIQGIGAGFVPAILDRGLISEVRVIDDAVAYRTKQRLARQEGLLVGISAGAAVHVAMQVAAELGEGSVVVTVLCDTGERYFSLDEYFA
ncbi:MAG TPA: cysteine synthase A [Pseudomonadota bacterium]|nr:cysteine synthase A [Pseudomonadota bacterium]